MRTLKEVLTSSYLTRNEGLINAHNCSGFLRDVARELGIHMDGVNADAQIDFMERAWIKLGQGNGVGAWEVARAGFLVVAGLKSADYLPEQTRTNGHVVVVIPSVSLHNEKFPYAWGGDLGKKYQSRGQRAIDEIFRRTKLESVRYYKGPQLFLRAGESYESWETILRQ